MRMASTSRLQPMCGIIEPKSDAGFQVMAVRGGFAAKQGLKLDKALLGGIALATVISIEFLPIGKNDGIKLVARGSDVMPKYLRLCTVTTGKLLDARREDAIRFLTAQMQGYGYALANRDEELRLTREIAGIKATDPRPEFMFAEAARADTGIDPKMPIAIA